MVQESRQYPDGTRDISGDTETPFKGNVLLRLTEAEAAGIRAFIRELKPGVYIKCSNCDRFKFSGVVVFAAGGEFLCESCS